MSTVDHVTQHAGFRRRVLGKLSAYGSARSVFSRAFRSNTGCTMGIILRPFVFVSASVERGAERISDRRERSYQGTTCPDVQSILSDVEFGRVDPTGWFPHYKNCVQHFVDYSQHTPQVQSIAAFINIRLPCQKPELGAHISGPTASDFVSLRPYIRRLIVTAQDSPAVMHSFFGGSWEAGVGCIYKQERFNYLFTAKSSGWRDTKAAYDMATDEQTPFLRPLRDPSEEEIRIAEGRWSEWLAMEDWMIGARSPW
ncbi:hypothetical protein N7457_005863 [Penicillium paradoxum]|uniref:uncharacterized protein n=1 Tax=Penicillium paradoxum TaxID=176176 RepID=UPI002549804C|nr:uncharacterized protein N7457_005863 [Penicillium paradoxum]KAJ5780703.1 hypothetical protein N7457_005863 [Penicillium paradoxum]